MLNKLKDWFNDLSMKMKVISVVAVVVIAGALVYFGVVSADQIWKAAKDFFTK